MKNKILINRLRFKPVTSHFIYNVLNFKTFLHKLLTAKVFRDVGEMLNTKWVTNYPEEEARLACVVRVLGLGMCGENPMVRLVL